MHNSRFSHHYLAKFYTAFVKLSSYLPGTMVTVGISIRTWIKFDFYGTLWGLFYLTLHFKWFLQNCTLLQRWSSLMVSEGCFIYSRNDFRGPLYSYTCHLRAFLLPQWLLRTILIAVKFLHIILPLWSFLIVVLPPRWFTRVVLLPWLFWSAVLLPRLFPKFI